ncbi:rab3 GTPase-activating protein catalytic subunit isoform X1 [Salmo salar]|uniref:Rab3 GTPase-activating protein catalytic subunit n=1 Tax=Salmo salar TaxID=8030 RepID=A0A1S3PNS0_SALSA|nr:rab3 GTPase-activating protein catalytic subunit isoform X1 [Salmo salar]|eukprot:XP_014028939.1 PREDICTED: rab3 GTPase-activating protein catalytic subunit-like isoform X1 [Salmo salar]
MAADSDPESEVFEITDFTTASEWERFVSRVEEVLNDWKLIGNNSSKPPEKGEYTSGTWEEKTQDINFADFKFSVTHHCLKQESEEGEGKEEPEEDAFPTAMQDLLCMNNDFPPRAHCLVRWYGMREFVVISPGANCEAVISESKCNLLLSSISISLANTGCQVPMFVQIQQKWRRMYHGECQGLGVRTDFEMVHLRKVPSQYNHLSGLLDIFKSKIGCPLTPLPPINIAIRFTYVLQDWQQYSWPQQPPDFDALLGGEVGGVEFGKLPFGACEDPISELHLATTWPHLTEGIVVDNDVYSDLDPLQAPHWSVRVRKADSPTCLLGDFLTEFFKLCSKKESAEEILGRGPVEEEGKDDISHALSKLTEPTAVPIPKLSVSNMVHSARKRIRRHRRVDESPLSNDVLNSILLYLFPDAAVDKSSSENSESKASQLNTDGKPEEKESDDYNLYNQLKSAPSDSLTYRLALCVCLVNFYHGGVRAVAHLWQEFVLEMRYRWENNYLVYGLASGPPDLRCCLLHQKLQMLNCCIERKRARDDGRKTAEGGKERERGRERKKSGSTGTENGRLGPESAEMGREVSPGKSWDSWSDSEGEDEFFECLSDTEEMKEAASTDGEKGGAKVAKPEGRLHPHGKLTLLNSQEPLYIPVTQEPAPMTEDLLEEQSEVLAKLGTSAEGAHLRARMQSACLLSDMESFKAANPGCTLEDFVRWYSPRDYVEEEVVDENGDTVVRGDLSARMKIPGNMWMEAWATAKTTPARRQRRLFDDTKEAEKVLHYLAVQKPADLTRHLLPCILHAAILKEKEEESVEDILSARKAIQQATSHASKLLRHPSPDYKKLEDVITQLIAVETVIARSRSLKAKFGIGKAEQGDNTEDLERFVSSLLEEPEVSVIGAGRGPAGSIIHKLFVSAQRLADYSSDEAALLAPLDEDTGRGGGADDKKPMGGASVPDFPPPAGREILLRTCVPRPAPYSKALPQRLFCVLMREDFRLAGAFSSDTSFF